MVYTVKSADTDSGQRFIAAVNSVLSLDGASGDGVSSRVAFDCEGVNLSRLGSLEIVSICFSTMEIYLIDVGNNNCSRILRYLKDLFESEVVTKIIHDCRKDCDVLYHLHGIKVKNVHDTSCFHDIIARTMHKSLNDVLMFNGISCNYARDNSVYKNNPRFWSTRPLTKRMVSWASSDVNKLFILADKQLRHASRDMKRTANAKSQEYSKSVRDMKVCSGLRVKSPGQFVGHGGQNIKSLSKRTRTLIYQDSSNRGSWYVYYDNHSSLNVVKRSMSM
mmetsp:Transcript_28522/g.60190  ORF Transcript_28522/g.60190 Transcript_28522/m.60190 type:complete len:277 (-) Transcript_28522:168-998(-)